MNIMMFIHKTEPSDYRTKATDATIKDIIKSELKFQGIFADLKNIDVSEVTDMSDLFYGLAFNGNISEWDVSNVKNMNKMFYGSTFNGDISHWNVKNVKHHAEFCDESPLENQPDKWPKFPK